MQPCRKDTAADRYGCSYWSDPSVAKRLKLETGAVTEARIGLVRKRIVAFRYPLYQILSLEGGKP